MGKCNQEKVIIKKEFTQLKLLKTDIVQHQRSLISAKRTFVVFSAGMILVVVFLCLSLAACSKPGAPLPGKPIKEDNFLLIGLVPEQNIFKQVDRYELIADYLSGKIGVRVKLIVLPSYGDIVGNFSTGGMDGAFLGSLTYLLMHEKLGVEIICRPEDPDGISTYRGVIFSREDSGIRSVRGMKGKRFAFVDKASAAGYLLPVAFFRKNGIADFKGYLKEVYFAGTHEDSIYDVLYHKADVGAAKSSVFKRIAAADPRVAAELHVISYSPDFPEGGLAVRKDLDAATKGKLRDALLNMRTDPAGIAVLKQFGADRFLPTTDEDYQPLYGYLQEMGIKLSAYDFADGQ